MYRRPCKYPRRHERSPSLTRSARSSSRPSSVESLTDELVDHIVLKPTDVAAVSSEAGPNKTSETPDGSRSGRQRQHAIASRSLRGRRRHGRRRDTTETATATATASVGVIATVARRRHGHRPREWRRGAAAAGDCGSASRPASCSQAIRAPGLQPRALLLPNGWVALRWAQAPDGRVSGAQFLLKAHLGHERGCNRASGRARKRSPTSGAHVRARALQRVLAKLCRRDVARAGAQVASRWSHTDKCGAATLRTPEGAVCVRIGIVSSPQPMRTCCRYIWFESGVPFTCLRTPCAQFGVRDAFQCPRLAWRRARPIYRPAQTIPRSAAA